MWSIFSSSVSFAEGSGSSSSAICKVFLSCFLGLKQVLLEKRPNQTNNLSPCKKVNYKESTIFKSSIIKRAVCTNVKKWDFPMYYRWPFRCVYCCWLSFHFIARYRLLLQPLSCFCSGLLATCPTCNAVSKSIWITKGGSKYVHQGGETHGMSGDQ